MLLTSTVRPFSGFVYGLTQPTLLLEIQLSPDLSMQMDLEVFDALMSEWLIAHNFASGLAESGPQAVLERLMKLYLALQSGQKVPVFGSGKILGVSPGDQPGSMRAVLVLPYLHVTASRIALGWSMQTLNTLLFSPPRDLATDQVRQKLQASQQKLLTYAASDTNTIHFLRTAFDMGVTAWRLWSTGYGFGLASRMRRLQSSTTDETKAIAVFITHSKRLTAEMLRRHGIPTPQHQWVKDAQEALAAAAKMGYPVVIKPDDQEQGRGVSAGLTNPSAVEAAFMQACALSKTVLVEKHHEGQDYRLTVFRNQVIKVIQRRPAAVVGDGVHNIQELVNLLHQTPRYQRLLRSGRRVLGIDAETLDLLRERSYTSLSIPPAGEEVVLRRKSNISAGGNQTLVPLDQIHPDNLDLAIRACQAIQLDLCGVDLIAPDISQSWHDTGAVIIELNAKPQIGIDLEPEAYARILTSLGEGQWTIPVQLVVCQSSAAVPSPAELIALCGAADGIASPDGVWVENRLILKQPDSGFEASRTLMFQSSVHVAICCMTVEEVLNAGLPIPHFDRIVLFNSTAERANEPEQWHQVRQMVNKHTPNLVSQL